jgi:hypothetical protein
MTFAHCVISARLHAKLQVERTMPTDIDNGV